MTNSSDKPDYLTPAEMATLQSARQILTEKRVRSPELDGVLGAARLLQARQTRSEVKEAVQIPAETPADASMDDYFDISTEVLDGMEEGLEDYQKTAELTRQLKSTFDTYLQESGGVISAAVFQRIREMFNSYDSAFDGEKDRYKDPTLCLKYAQLRVLMTHPAFMKDSRAVATIESLADSKRTMRAPWGFEMFLDYDRVESRYYLKEGFGAEQVPVLSELANSGALWERGDTELRRIFMSSIGEGLKYITQKYPHTLLDSLGARIEIMDRNRVKDNHHSPQCKSSLSRAEVMALQEIGNVPSKELDAKTMTILRKVLFDGGYEQTNHAC